MQFSLTIKIHLRKFYQCINKSNLQYVIKNKICLILDKRKMEIYD